MKNILQILLILQILVQTIACTEKQTLQIWNGKTSTLWYSDSKDEFTITTPEQLAGLAKLVNNGIDFSGKTVKLGRNIMLNDTANWRKWERRPPKNKWTPIGRVYGFKKFNGTFDGNGFAISGIYINSASDYMGLFGRLNSSGDVKNLGVTASYIKGNFYIGGIAGGNVGTIKDCYFIGTVTGEEVVGGIAGYSHGDGIISGSYSIAQVTGEYRVGGLVGDNYPSSIINDSYSISLVTGREYVGGFAGINDYAISNSYSSATVTGKEFVGGLAGSNSGVINDSYSIGTVIGQKHVGGLAGRNETFGNIVRSSIISGSYSISTVMGENEIGGLAGNSTGDINNSYSISTVMGKHAVGGLVGHIKYSNINDSYSIGMVTGKSDVGGLVGAKWQCSEINSSYFASNIISNDKDYEGKIIAEMKEQSTFEGWNFKRVWGIDGNINSGYPYLLEKPEYSNFFSGNGTKANPYKISTKEHLEIFSELVNNGNNFAGKVFRLEQNIAFNDTANWQNWAESPPAYALKVPIGILKKFSGTFDGNDFAISGVYIDSSEYFGRGLFADVGSLGEIKKLFVAAIYINKEHFAGNICYSGGWITFSSLGFSAEDCIKDQKTPFLIR
jgi:hypothetical protein